jgi:hypothetical protein
VSEALDKAWKTLGECSFFDEYFLSGTRQRKVVVTTPSDGDGDCAECHGDTWQRFTLCRVSTTDTRQRSSPWVPLSVPLPRVLGGTRQKRLPLCRVPRWTSTRQRDHQRAPLSVPLPSALGGTRQRLLLCRIPRLQHSAKKLYRFPDVPSLPSAMTLTLGKVPPAYPFLFVFIIPSKQIKDISHIHHIYHI